MWQKGGILIILLILVLLVGVTFWTLKASLTNLPGEPLYSVKQNIEAFRLFATELSYVKRIALYIDFANERLDEVESLEEKQAPPSMILKGIENFWETEQLILREFSINHVKTEDTTQVREDMGELVKRQSIILKRILDKTPNPEFFRIYQIIEESDKKLLEAGFR